MKQLRRQLDDEAKERGVAFVLDSGGVVLDPTECYTCNKWGGKPTHCPHVDENVGIMVREVLALTEEQALQIVEAEGGEVWACSWTHGAWSGEGDTAAFALASLLLQLWQSSPIVDE